MERKTKITYLSRYLNRYIICERNPTWIPSYGRYILQQFCSTGNRKSLFWGSESYDPRVGVINFEAKTDAIKYLEELFVGEYKDYGAVARVTSKGLRRIYPRHSRHKDIIINARNTKSSFLRFS